MTFQQLFLKLCLMQHFIFIYEGLIRVIGKSLLLHIFKEIIFVLS